MLHLKFVKYARRARWRFRPEGDLPLVWHSGRPNFGDDINPELFGRFSGDGFRSARRGERALLGVGSILERAAPNATVVGSGYLRRPEGPVAKPARVVAVRGELSAAALGVDDAWLGDPMLLVDRLVGPRPAAESPIGVVPHLREIDRFGPLASRGVRMIDVRRPPWEVVDAIHACETVYSQSLHGLIVADALGVPNVWLAPSDRMAGGTFKFDDYYSVMDTPKRPRDWAAELLTPRGADDAFVSRYRYDKAAYHRALAGAIDAFAAEHRGRLAA